MTTRFLKYILLCALCDGAEILAFLPLPVRSHHFVFQPLLKELVNRGHHLTVVSPYPLDKPMINYTEIVIHTEADEVFESNDYLSLRRRYNVLNALVELHDFLGFTHFVCECAFKMIPVQDLIHSRNAKFDLVITEQFFGLESTAGFSVKFGAPLVVLASFGSTFFIDQFMGNPLGAAYIPYFEIGYTDEMNFFQRLHNTLTELYVGIMTHIYFYPRQDALFRTYFNYTGAALPPLIDVLKNTSMVLLNTHVSVGFPRPYVQNVIEVGGMHVGLHRKLSHELEDFLNNAEGGFVYVSMGSNIKVSRMNASRKQAFLNVFKSLKPRFLWKCDDDSLGPVPANIRLGKWFPQQAILAHPKCLAFITHGGLLSLEEAIYFGIPLIGIPVFGDQDMNMGYANKWRIAVTLDYENITEDSLLWALQMVLNNSMYRQNMKRQSAIYRDRPEGALEKAVFWVEYTMRHRGAPHLRSAAVSLCWYQYFLLDIVVVLLGSLVTLYFLLVTAVRKVCKTKCSGRTAQIDFLKKGK